MFAQEKLQGYGKALDFAAQNDRLDKPLGQKHALVDHLSKGDRKHPNLIDKAEDKVGSHSIHP